MPGIVLFKRRWGFGSDDLVFPGLLEIMCRTLWLIVVIAVYLHHYHGFNCTTGYLLAKIYQVIIAVLVLHIISAVSVVWCSTRGTILDTTARKAAPLLLYIKLFLVLPETAWIVISIYWAFQNHQDCSLDAVLTVKVAILVDCAVAVVVVIGTAILFDPVGVLSHEPDDKKRIGILAQKTRKVWEKRINFLFCCFPRHEHSRMAFKDIAEHITVFFKGLDVVPTDIAAGLILLYHHELGLRKQSDDTLTSVSTHQPINHVSSTTSSSSNSLSNTRETNSENLLTEIQVENEISVTGIEAVGVNGHRVGDSDKDWTNINLLVHYMKYAMASYGWPLYCMMYLGKSCCQMFGGCRCCYCCCHQADAVSMDDNCYQGNTRAILNFTGLRIEDILYASFHNAVYEVPFFIAVDHEQKALVVAIRGTLSIWDVLTDLTSACEEINALADSSTGPCMGHKGMTQAAHIVVDKLKQLGLLEQTFQKYPDYHLVLTGHSLGAGTATIVTLLLRERYPNVRCYAYSPPATLSRPIVEGLDDLICSVVLGEDLVPRMSFLTMLHLRDKVHQQLRQAQQPKYKILASGLWYLLCGLPCVLERSLFGKEEIVSSDSSQRVPLLQRDPANVYNALRTVTSEGEEDDGGEDDDEKMCPLYPSGRIFHITNYRSVNERVTYSWPSPMDFDEIVVHPMMLFDHLPDVVYRALTELEKQATTSAADSQNAV